MILSDLPLAGIPALSGAEVMWAQQARHLSALLDTGSEIVFLKAKGKPLVGGSVSLSGEITARRVMAVSGQRHLLEPAVPRLRDAVGAYDPEVLVFDGMAGTTDLRSRLLRQEAPASDLAPALGSWLANLHRIPAEEAKASGARELRPEIPNYYRVRPRDLAHSPRCFREFLRLVQLDRELGERLWELNDRWQPSTFVHGDLKLNNILCTDAPSVSPCFFLVDWELSGVGDPGWDLGSLVGSYFYTRLEALNRSNARPEGNADLILDVHRLLGAYREACPEDPRVDERIAACFYWAAASLLLRTQIVLPIRRRLTALDLASIHLAADLLLEAPV